MKAKVWNALKRFFFFIHRILYAVFVKLLLQLLIAKLFLFIVYFFIIGPTAVAVRINRKLNQTSNASAGWQEARGYKPTLDESARQS